MQKSQQLKTLAGQNSGKSLPAFKRHNPFPRSGPGLRAVPSRQKRRRIIRRTPTNNQPGPPPIKPRFWRVRHL